MRRLILVVTSLLLLATPAQAQATIPVSELSGAGAEYDSTEVTVEGELVGDIGERRDGTVWTQLNDDSYARDPLRDSGTHDEGNTGIGVRIDGSLGYQFEQVGGYRWRGPIVAATGIWHHHDPERGGESYLEVTALEFLEAPRLLTDSSSSFAWAIGGILIVAAALLYLRQRSDRT